MADMLVTIAQVKARLDPSGVVNTNDDTLLTELVEQVTSFVQGFTGRRIVAEAGATKLFDTTYGNVLRIPAGIRAITSIGTAQTHQPDSGGSYTSLTAAQVLKRPITSDLPQGWPYLEVRLPRSNTQGLFATAENGCTITGDFGWLATPPDLQAVCIDATVVAFQMRRNGASGAIGPDATQLPPWVAYFSPTSPQRATLERYRYASL